MSRKSSGQDKRSDRICIRAIARALAASVSAVDIDSCRIVKKGNRSAGPDKNINQTVNGYLSLVDAVKREPRLREFESALRDAGCSPFLLQEILVALVTTGFYADLQETMRKDTAVVNAVNKHVVVLDRALLGLATLLESSLHDFSASLQEKIVAGEEDVRYFQMRFTSDARRKGAPANRIDHFNALFNQVLWRTERQAPEALAGRCVQIIDKTAAKYGITPQMRRTLSRRLSAMDYFQQGDAIMKETLEQAMSADLLYGDDAPSLNGEAGSAKAGSSSKTNYLGIGAALMGIGGVVTIGSIASLGSIGGAGLLMATGGVISLLVGLIYIIIGAISKTFK